MEKVGKKHKKSIQKSIDISGISGAEHPKRELIKPPSKTVEKEIISLFDFRNVLDEALIDVTFEIKGGRRDGVLVTDAIKARGIK